MENIIDRKQVRELIKRFNVPRVSGQILKTKHSKDSFHFCQFKTKLFSLYRKLHKGNLLLMKNKDLLFVNIMLTFCLKYRTEEGYSIQDKNSIEK